MHCNVKIVSNQCANCEPQCTLALSIDSEVQRQASCMVRSEKQFDEVSLPRAEALSGTERELSRSFIVSQIYYL